MATVTQFKIEKNVDFPSRNTGSRAALPFSDMEVGDSFFVPNVTTTQISSRCQYYKLRYGYRFTTRAIDGGVRIWRTA